MNTLTADDILNAWDAGHGQHPLDRALTLLRAAEPGASRRDLAGLPVGERDARLLALFAAHFGGNLSAFAECPACGERVEFAIPVERIRLEHGGRGEYSRVEGDLTVRFRLPNSRDLADALGCADIGAARRRLAERCLVAVERGGSPVPLDAISESDISGLASAMAEADPQADVSLDLTCPGCRGEWSAPFDIGAFLWARLATEARRILREVDALARAYGWRESDILSLSPSRRRMYVGMVVA